MKRVFLVNIAYLIFAIVTASLLETAPSFGQEPASDNVPYVLRWFRDADAESCIDADTLAAKLAVLAGKPLASSSLPARVLEGHASRAAAPNRFQVALSVYDGNGTLVGSRVIVTNKANCLAMDSSLLLVLAMSIHPENDLEPEVGTVAPTGLPSPEEVRPRPAVPIGPIAGDVQLTRRELRVSSMRTTPKWALFNGIALSTGVVPQPSPGIVLGVRRKLTEQLTLSVSSAIWLPERAFVEPSWSRAINARIGAAWLRAGVCERLFARSSFSVEGCAGGQIGLRWLESSGLHSQGLGRQPFYAPTLALGTAYHLLRGIRLRAGFGVSAQFPKTRFTYADYPFRVRHLHTPARFSGDGYLGLEFAM